jgi:hypothetical protein
VKKEPAAAHPTTPAPLKTRKLLITSLLLLGLAAGLGSAGLWGYRRIHPASLDAWAAGVAGPGYKLRYRTRTRTHYVAVFQVGPDQLAFCRKRLAGACDGPEPAPTITDVWGSDLVDPSRPRQELFRVWDLGVTQVTVDDGQLIPIRPDFRGRMRIVFDADRNRRDVPPEEADPYRLKVLDVHIQWGDHPAQPSRRKASAQAR